LEKVAKENEKVSTALDTINFGQKLHFVRANSAMSERVESLKSENFKWQESL